jgi:hypothetical protein
MDLRGGSPLNKVVARYADGRVVKGTTANFHPAKDVFHVAEAGAPPGTPPVEVVTSELKALIFVKDFTGDPSRIDRNELDPSCPLPDRPIRVEFKDGEVMVGLTTGYQPGRRGFFLEPVDGACNLERCYVVVAATQKIGYV